jgi:hypothetical protein
LWFRPLADVRLTCLLAGSQVSLHRNRVMLKEDEVVVPAAR